jgi:hypothetical protein
MDLMVKDSIDLLRRAEISAIEYNYFTVKVRACFLGLVKTKQKYVFN